MRMKRFLIIAAIAFSCTIATAQSTGSVKYTEASTLTLIGKLMDTPNPYHRIDTVKYKGFTASENRQVRCSAGEAVLFKTNAKKIWLDVKYGAKTHSNTTMDLAERGFDLYMKKDGKWIWAGAACPNLGSEDGVIRLIDGMDGSSHECMLYLPIYCELYSLKIGVPEEASIEALESPFRHRIGIFGSSFTHGISCSRAGMAYPAQFTRHTGLQMLSIACSGNCKLQPYFAEVLKDADVDALVFDAFSNPSAEMIEERLFPFIEKIQETHPDIPLIFQRTIYREWRNFNKGTDEREKAKAEMAEKMMKEACKKYKNVYFITPNASSDDHETTVDGTHPSDEGYRRWSVSIEKQIVRILRKYGIR